MRCRLVIYTAQCVNRFAPKYSRAQRYLDSEVLRDSAPYTPMRTGYLMKSGNTGTVIGSGKVIYNAPHAKKCYYARHVRFSKDKHPQACAQWVEPAKATKLPKWKEGVGKILRGEA